MGSGPRLELLDILCQGPRTVDAIAKQAGLSVANTSHHLQVLRQARLVDAEKNGVHVTYRPASNEVCEILQRLRRIADSQLPEIEQISRDFLLQRGAMEPVDRDALITRVRNGKVTLIDVRPAEEYSAGHISGALSFPLEEIKSRLAELPRDFEVVAYCRGPYCVMAIDAVEILTNEGFDAIRMEDGVPDWRMRGLPVEYSTTLSDNAPEQKGS